MKNTHLKGVSFLLFSFLLLISLGSQAQVIKKTSPGEEDEKTAEEYDLTDKDRFESQTFIHEGLSQRKRMEECEKLKDPNACQGQGKTKFLGVDSSLVMMVSKAYSVIGGMVGMMGGGMDFKAKSEASTSTSQPASGDTPGGHGQTTANPAHNTAGEGAKDAPQKDGESKKDYCVLIPAAGETVAMFYQQMSQDNLNKQPTTKETKQKELLYRAARSHQARARSAKIQGTVWGATTACYAAYMAFGGISIDWKVIAKTAAAGFLTFFWLNEAKQQENYAKEVNRIAESLPGRGDCNPHTEKNCYCAQPETQYDPVHCLPELHKKAVANNSFKVPCVDVDLKADAQCDCISQEACFDSKFFSEFKGPGFAKFSNSSAGNDFKKLTRGELSNGKIGAGQTGLAGRTRGLLGDLADKIDKDPSLSKSELAGADVFEDFGAPKPVARLLASRPITSEGRKKMASVGAISANPQNVLKKAGLKRNSTGVLTFNSRGIGKIGPGKSRGGDNQLKSMLNRFKKKKGSTNNNKVLKFAERAERQAQISRNKDRPIFEIISRRYQVSGWKRLDIQ